MEKHTIEKIQFDGDLRAEIDDDLIYHVPIYDNAKRRFAAFCSFTEAIWHKQWDVKGNGNHFKDHNIAHELDWLCCFYLFRLCGSGINYKPKQDHFYGTHGFGNFWLIDSILNGKYQVEEWLEDLAKLDRPFTDNKGYLLPQFSFKELTRDHLKHFILKYSCNLVCELYEAMVQNKMEIYQVTDLGNKWLKQKGFKAQNFVLTAFAADVAEYFPHYVDPKSRVYAGTNATKCIKAIFPKKKGTRVSDFDYINDVLSFQADRYSLNPIDCEDTRNCDVVRYFQEYQSKDHIDHNGGMVHKNNSVLKKIWGEAKYYDFAKQLK